MGTTSTKVRKETANSRISQFKSDSAGMKIIGETITWNARADKDSTITHTRTSVIEALKAADLKEEAAKELKPKYAFTRAKQKLVEERIINELRQDSDTITFQFNKRVMEDKEFKFPKETLLVLNTITGKIKCDIAELELHAQKLLDKALEERTTSDITKLVQALFEEQEKLHLNEEHGLFPIREQGGVYFVFEPMLPFVDKIHEFLKALGGSMIRMPQVSGTVHGDKAVTDIVAAKFQNMIEELDSKVEKFSITTRGDTLETKAEEIKTIRLKMEAYADHLQEKSKMLLAALGLSTRKLVEKIQDITKAKEDAPAHNGDGREKWFEQSVTSVIRWMGKEGWSLTEAKKAIEKAGVPYSESTTRAQLLAGRKGERGDPAVLSKAQIKELKGEK